MDGPIGTMPRIDEAEGCSKDDDGESNGDAYELDDETMAAISSGNLPVSADTLVALNQVYQELLLSFMRHVEACLAENREKQKTLENELRYYSGEGSKKRENRVPVTLYLPPYFRDSADLAPMQNADAIAKAGELNILVDEPRKWTPAEKKRLLNAIGAAIVETESASFLNKRDALLETLKTCSDPEEITRLTAEVRELNKKLDAAKANVDIATATPKMFENIDWTRISVSEFEGIRSPVECRLEWTNELDPQLNQASTWTERELDELSQLAEQYEFRGWDKIARDLGTNRTAFQCFEKYQSECNRNLTKKSWTQDDDDQLRAAIQACRQGEYIPWDQVSSMVEGRTNTQCKIRWTRSLAPGLKSGWWNEAEDLLLLAAVEKYGSKNWSSVSNQVPGRTGQQCRERWESVLVSNARHGPWTPEEDSLLLEGVKQFGRGQWTKICNLIEGRRANACKVRYRTLAKKGVAALDIVPSGESSQFLPSRYSRARSLNEKKQRLVDAYTRLVGRGPVLRVLESNADKLLRPLPDHIQTMLKEKLSAVRKRVAVESRMMLLGSQRRKGVKPAKRIRRTDTEDDPFRAVMHERRPVPTQAHQLPVKALADMLAGTTALLPPTVATLKGARNLLSWHGAQFLVGTNPLQSLVASLLTDHGPEASNRSGMPNSVLTEETTTPMRSYMEERESGEIGATDQAGMGDLPDSDSLSEETILSRLVPNDNASMSSLLELRDVTRQLFLWPAILAMLKNSGDT